MHKYEYQVILHTYTTSSQETSPIPVTDTHSLHTITFNEDHNQSGLFTFRLDLPCL